MTTKKLSLLVVNLKGALLFCGIDATRIVFFEDLPINKFAADSPDLKTTTVTLNRNGKNGWEGEVYYTFYSQHESYVLTNTEKFFRDGNLYTKYLIEEVIKANLLSEGDILTVTKNDCKDEEELLDKVAGDHETPTYPSNKIVSDDFSEAFHFHIGLMEDVTKTFNISQSEVNKKIVTIQRKLIIQ